VKDDLYASRDQHGLERLGNRATNQHVHTELGHTLRSRPRLSFFDSRRFPPDLRVALDVHHEEMLGDIKNRRDPVGPRWNSHFHHRA
jgi:hypothetical protein